MAHTHLSTQYGQIRLRVEFDPAPGARLLINDIQRDEQCGSQVPCILRLSSTVQTGYEWHEHIEAVVHYEPDCVSVRLVANNTELAHRTFPVTA